MPWPFPFLTALRNMRGQQYGAAPAQPATAPEDAELEVPVTSTAVVDTEIPDGAGMEIPRPPRPEVVTEVPPEYITTFTPVGGNVYKGSEYSAMNVKFDIYSRAIRDNPYSIKCPSSPFYDKDAAFQTYDDAKWYVEEVVHGSRTENLAAAKAAKEAAADAAAIAKFEKAGFI